MKCIKSLFLIITVLGGFQLFAKQTVKPNAAPSSAKATQGMPTTVIPQQIQPIAQPMPVRPIQVQPVQPQPPLAKTSKDISKGKQGQALYHLITTDPNTLRKFDLCPLFGKNGGRYPIFNPAARLHSGEIKARFEWPDVAQNAPCTRQLGQFGEWTRTVMQIKTLDQFELADKTGLSAAMCGGLSLNNGRLIRDYALTGNMEDLRRLHNIDDATAFLLDLKIGDWLNADTLRDNIDNLSQTLGINGIDVSAVSTVCLFDSNLNEKPGFAIFDQPEFAYAQKVKKNIQAGLKQDNYVHIMIIGDEETVETALGHYFCFAIIKSGNEIQYVVLDTIPSAYHLQRGSHAIDRLMFVIQNIEQGYSAITVANIRVKLLQMREEERKASL